MLSHVGKYTRRWESDGRKVPIRWEKMCTNFPGFSNSMDFTAFSHAMGNWWGNPCISQIIKYTIGYESNGKKDPVLWEKYENRFPRFSTYDGFCRIYLETNFPGFSHLMGFPAFSHAMRYWWENLCISHMMTYTTRWKSNGKKHPHYGKSMSTNFPGSANTMGFVEYCWEPVSLAFPIRWFWLSFQCYGKLMRKHMHFPCDEVYHKMGI